MPIYEYQCQTCGHRLETMQKMSDAPLTECPACHAPALRKLMSAAAVQVRGGGDDYRPRNEAVAEPVCGAGACSACQLD